MSSIFVQVGQCGNQVGNEFYKTVNKLQNQRPIFLSEDDKWRSINVDSEAKVINSIFCVNKSRLRESNIIRGRHGRGSNWALGYHGIGKDKILSRTLEALRREVERCDSYSGTVIIHSLGGGTGSGLGSHLCESIRDEYPLAYILSAAIAPHITGESPLQHYNVILSLAWLQRFSDAIVIFKNDEILRQTAGFSLTKPRKSSQLETSLADMNTYISNCLAGVFLPLDTCRKKGNSDGICIGNEPWEMTRSVCPMPAYKLLHTACVCKSRSSWKAITDGLVSTLNRYDQHENPFFSLANLAVIRGDTNLSSIKTVEDKLKAGYNCVGWNPFPVDFWTGMKNLVGTTEQSLTVCANTNSCAELARYFLMKAKVMQDSRAYLHWYEQWGCDESYFTESFQTMETVIEAYTSNGIGVQL